MANLTVLLRFTRSSRGASAAPRARYCSRPRVRVVAPADMRAASGERGLGLVRSLGCQRLSVGVAIGTHHFGTGGGAARQLLMGARVGTHPGALLQLSPHSEVKGSGIHYSPSLINYYY